MESFVAYSDSDSQSDGDGAGADGVPAFRPAWQRSDDEESGDEEDGETKTSNVERRPKREAPEISAAAAEPKKRRLMDPFAAMSQASKSFLAADKANDDDAQYFTVRDKDGDVTRSSNQPPVPPQMPHKESSEAEAGHKLAPAPPLLRAPPAGTQSTRKEETTRQKNARKQKMGQATFTAKSNRDCPDIWHGAS
jgi:hypothetical protein